VLACSRAGRCFNAVPVLAAPRRGSGARGEQATLSPNLRCWQHAGSGTSQGCWHRAWAADQALRSRPGTLHSSALIVLAMPVLTMSAAPGHCNFWRAPAARRHRGHYEFNGRTSLHFRHSGWRQENGAVLSARHDPSQGCFFAPSCLQLFRYVQMREPILVVEYWVPLFGRQWWWGTATVRPAACWIGSSLNWSICAR